MNQPKKRLRMMPEVLPAPQKNTHAGPSVRERTLARLKLLTALSAATFTGVGAACSGGTGAGPGGGDGGDAGNDGPSREECDPYCVVDPLPPPTCFDKSEGVRQQLTATATYGTGDAGADAGDDAGEAGVDAGDAATPSGYPFELLVTFETPIGGLVLGESKVQSGTMDIDAATLSMTTIRVVGRVPSKNQQATLRIQLSCAKGPTSVTVQLDFNEDTIVANANTY